MGSRFSWAPTAYKMLDGIFCIFKPPGLPVFRAVESIQRNLASDLNALPCYEYEIPLTRSQPIAENETETSLSIEAEPVSLQNWSEHRLVLGPRFETSDFRIRFVDGMSSSASGILVLGIGRHGQRFIDLIAQAKYLRVYHLKGRFGWATDNFTAKGRVLERTSYKHVTRSKLEKVCAAVQAAYSKQMHVLSGVDPDSQEAYEMASSGIIRPAKRHTSPLLYGVRCIDFQLPDFTLEVHSINEQGPLLNRLIHDIAVKLKTLAVCSGVRRLRYGHFTLDRALVRQQWHLEQIVDNIESNEDLLTPDKLLVGARAEKVKLLPPRGKGVLLPGPGDAQPDSCDTADENVSNFGQNSDR
ncbi:mitochondrial mRNA pseudouridine synthase Trub2 [Aplysia californica]|uniref:Mitochondrial mRNA pseudouridine synthase Trub2 n=1 Tax=Aplysia californica TaxID=6500 RepID=A0ABM0JD43_APLCA|nr:mitochondrial mRNA pseudouridine synthase Trub2 [Aplysia californica]